MPGDRISDRRYDDSCSGMNGGSAEAIEGLERLWEEMLQIASNILTDYQHVLGLGTYHQFFFANRFVMISEPQARFCRLQPLQQYLQGCGVYESSQREH